MPQTPPSPAQPATDGAFWSQLPEGVTPEALQASLTKKLERLGVSLPYRQAVFSLVPGAPPPDSPEAQLHEQALRDLLDRPLQAPTRESGMAAMKLLINLARNTQLLAALLAVRLEGIELLHDHPAEMVVLPAQKALHIYAPLAARLGIFWIKAELEDLAFRMLDSETYRDLKRLVGKRRDDRAQQVEELTRAIRELLEQHHMKPEIQGRYKRFYSIFEKLPKVGYDFDRIQDLIAFRIILPRVRDCYAALGYIHERWKPKEKRFKDYITQPKPNGYQSLHTTLEVGPDSLIEVQIRTHAMHSIAEYGVAAHWRYKDQRRGLNDEGVGDEGASSEAQRQELSLDWYDDRTFVQTPAHEVLELPRGATALDFAYALHSKIGDTTVGVKLDGAIVKLDTKLPSGCQAEVLTSTKQVPSKEWLEFVVTPRARQKIRYAIRRQHRAELRHQGIEQAEKAFRQAGLNWNRLLKEGRLEQACQLNRNQSLEHTLFCIGEGSVRASEMVGWFAEPEEALKPLEPPREFRHAPNAPARFVVSGLGDIVTRVAKCCHPEPFVPVVGYLTQGREVRVHRSDCEALKDLEPQRLVEVSWSVAPEGRPEKK